MKNTKRKKSAGFTLIELVIVIVLLGILSAVALPRFIDLSDEANLTAQRHIYITFKTALQNAQAKWQTAGGEERILSLKGTVPDTLFSEDGLILSASQDIALTTSSTRLNIIDSNQTVSESNVENEICANIFRNLMSDNSLSIISRQSSTVQRGCTAGAQANPSSKKAKMCTNFVRSYPFGSPLGAHCTYYFNYDTKMDDDNYSYIEYYLSPNKPGFGWSVYPPGSVIFVIVKEQTTELVEGP